MHYTPHRRGVSNSVVNLHDICFLCSKFLYNETPCGEMWYWNRVLCKAGIVFDRDEQQKLNSSSKFWCRLFQECTNFPNSRRQKGDVKDSPYWGSTYIKRRRTKFSRHGNLAPGICAPVDYVMWVILRYHINITSSSLHHVRLIIRKSTCERVDRRHCTCLQLRIRRKN
jgi:hypothetical protein